MHGSYYNEFDHKAAAWLRELIKLGVIPDGDVDERSICDVRGSELAGYVQCHFFAGIGGWPYALRLAGWPDDRPVWTGSCPCQAFSVAGKGEGTSDHRDLWPVFAGLIRERNPSVVFGEQVAAAIGYGWLDRLRTDLEAEGYAVGGHVLGAHSAGAPHGRQRLYWVADLQGNGRAGHGGVKVHDKRNGQACAGIGRVVFDGVEQCVATDLLAHNPLGGLGADGSAQWEAGHDDRAGEVGRMAESEHANRRAEHEQHGEAHGRDGLGRRGNAGGVDEPAMSRHESEGRGQQGESERRKCLLGVGREAGGVVFTGEQGSQGQHGHGDGCDEPGRLGAQPSGHVAAPSARHFWSRAIPIPCRDGKYRLAEPGIFPLVNGIPRGVVPSGDPGLPEYANSTPEGRVMRLKGYGNAIVPQVAAMFVRAFMGVGHGRG